MKIILLGIGNELKKDDGIGNVIAREFKETEKADFISIPAETVPENFTSVIRKEEPDVLVIVDAAQMGLLPGEFRVLSKKRLDSEGFGTHGMPLSHLVSYLEDYASNIYFIGIQPKSVDMGDEISPEVEKGKKALIEIIKKKEWEAIEKME